MVTGYCGHSNVLIIYQVHDSSMKLHFFCEDVTIEKNYPIVDLADCTRPWCLPKLS